MAEVAVGHARNVEHLLRIGAVALEGDFLRHAVAGLAPAPGDGIGDSPEVVDHVVHRYAGLANSGSSVFAALSLLVTSW
jgi:hypothetical protein